MAAAACMSIAVECYRFVTELDGVWLAFTETRPATVSKSSNTSTSGIPTSKRSRSSSIGALGFLLPDIESNDGTIFVSVETTALVFRPKVGDLISEWFWASSTNMLAADARQTAFHASKAKKSGSGRKGSSCTSSRQLPQQQQQFGLPSPFSLCFVSQHVKRKLCGLRCCGCYGSATSPPSSAENTLETDLDT